MENINKENTNSQTKQTYEKPEIKGVETDSAASVINVCDSGCA